MLRLRMAAAWLLLAVVAACTTTSPSPDRMPPGAAAPSPPAATETPPPPAPAETLPPPPAAPAAAPAPPMAEAPTPIPPAPAMAEPAPAPAPVAPPKRGKRPPPPADASAARTPAAKPAPDATKAAASSGLSGRLELAGGAGQSVAAGEVSDGLVYFLPKGGAPRPKPGRFSIDTRSKGFSPALLVVPIGSTVRFPNRDTILHNVFSRTPGTTFELGTYGPGEVREQVFARAGLVIVGCNVHHNMRANVVVLETPYYARPDRSGAFRLDNLPPGPGTLVFWHPRSNATTATVTLPSSAPVVRKLVASKPRLDAIQMGH